MTIRALFRRLSSSALMRGLALAAVVCVAPLAAMAGVNVNTAPAGELESLPGIGPSKAAAIIQYRTDNGPFASVDELQKVPGIGAKTVASLRAEAEVGDGQTVAKGAPASGGSSSSAAPSGNAVNINSANAAQLDALPGIGPSKAAAIIADRDAKGAFSSCDELSRVTGVGAKTVAQIKPVCKTAD
jgi:competence protein ComEA